MLKPTRSSEELTLKTFKAGNNEFVRGDGRADETVVDSFKSKNKKSRKSTYMPNIEAIEEPNFLTPNAKKTLNHLRLVFIKAPIL